MYDGKINVVFIRHGKTLGNMHRRYVGRTDEPLCQTGAAEIQRNVEDGIYPRADKVAISPMKRCYETARIIYPEQRYETLAKCRECDFGDFENKNYQDLQNNKDYKDWINSNGMMAFPNGESLKDFQSRCIDGFLGFINGVGKEAGTAALVIHGGTIMSILSRLCNVRKPYYEWMTGNGNGCICNWNGEMLEYVRNLK